MNELPCLFFLPGAAHQRMIEARFPLGHNVLEAAPTPVLLLKQSRLEFNVQRMAAFCRGAGVELAPHAKTTMSPEIVRRQLAAGAWGITVASVDQAAALQDVGSPRVLIANEVVDAAGLRGLDALLANGGSQVSLWVDSVAGVELLDRWLTRPPLEVFIEVGPVNGRAGCRTVEDACNVARAVVRSRNATLIGVSGFEGVLGDGHRSPGDLAEVRALLDTMSDVGQALVDLGLLVAETAILSAGGSVYFDEVARRLRRPIAGIVPTVVLRSGCYITHDHGVYAAANVLRDAPFRAALELVATVLSRPEAHVAILDFGRRNASFDAGLPVPLWVGQPTGSDVPLPGVAIDRLNDQHAYVELTDAAPPLAVGDTVGLGISHPCTTFDKWRVVPVVNDEYETVDLVTTRF